MEDKKDSKVNKGIFDIHVIDVFLTSARSSAWVFDTGLVAHICNLKQEPWNKRRLAKDEVTIARREWFQGRCDSRRHATSTSTFSISFRPQ